MKRAIYLGHVVNFHDYGNGKAYIETVSGDKIFPLFDPEALRAEGLNTHSASKIVNIDELRSLTDLVHSAYGEPLETE